MRRIGSPEMDAAQHFGRTLFDAIFAGPVSVCFHRSLETARSQNQGMHLRLRLNDAPTLTDLPWEFLFDTLHNHFLAYSTATPLVRYLDLPQGGGPLAVTPPLKILVMIANPQGYGYAPLDVEAEWQKVRRALADLAGQGLVEVTRLESATLAALQRQLRRDQYHIFHFVGHGGFDVASQSGVLLLEDDYGRSRTVSGHYLGALLRDHFSLRLALLNACEGARSSPADPFAGVAQHLVQQGIPAVIAMQFEITDGAAITLAHEFYGAVADGYPVDAALSEARKALYAAENDVEWGTPVLYMRAGDGALFDVTLVKPIVEKEPIAIEFIDPVGSDDSELMPIVVSEDTVKPEVDVQQYQIIVRETTRWRRPSTRESTVIVITVGAILLGGIFLILQYAPFFRMGGSNDLMTRTPISSLADGATPTFEITLTEVDLPTEVVVLTNTAPLSTPTFEITFVEERFVTISAQYGVNVRSEPNTDSEALRIAENGEEFLVLKELDGWLQILSSDGQFLWIGSDPQYVSLRTERLTLEESNQLRKQLTAIPTPTATETLQLTRTAARLPTHTPTPRPSASVNTSLGAAIRAAPVHTADALATATYEEVLIVTERTADNLWLQVDIVETQGWVVVSAVNLSVDLESLPVVNP